MKLYTIIRSYKPWGELEQWEIAGSFALEDVEDAKAMVNEEQARLTWIHNEGEPFWRGRGHYAGEPDWLIFEYELDEWLLDA